MRAYARSNFSDTLTRDGSFRTLHPLMREIVRFNRAAVFDQNHNRMRMVCNGGCGPERFPHTCDSHLLRIQEQRRADNVGRTDVDIVGDRRAGRRNFAVA